MEILATLNPSPSRRALAVGVHWALFALLLILALSTEGLDLTARAFLLGCAAGAIALGEQLRRATRVGLRLTEDGVETSEGDVLFRLEDVDHLDRGTFAFKPPNGFSVVLKDKARAVWRPGLYWRMGRRLGIAGVTSPSQAKFMAELLAQQLARL